MTEPEPDPRYDPAFQRGYSGGVDRLRGDERAFARPGPGPTPEQVPAPRSRPAPTPTPLSAEPERAVEDASTRPAAAPVAPPLRSNPWFLALLVGGLIGTVVGLVALTSALSAPPIAYGSGTGPSSAWVARQVLYYSCVPLIGCLPVALLLAAALAASRWRGRTRADPDERGDDGIDVLSA